MIVKVGIIGGSGLENPDIMKNARLVSVNTPFGRPSDVLIEGDIEGIPCVLVSRHGRKHDINPSKVNYRANLWALMEQGVTVIIASTACGSLKQEIKPGDLVFPDSVFDRTNQRVQTFFDGEEGHPTGVCHIQMHPSYNEKLRQILISCASKLGYSFHDGGFGVCIEGPRFSTMAESKVFKSWGASLVNMTMMPECLLAKELGIPYATAALVTDYDCWKNEEHVSMELVMETFSKNVMKAKTLFINAVAKIAKTDWNEEVKKLKESARSSVMVPPEVIITHLQC